MKRMFMRYQAFPKYAFSRVHSYHPSHSASVPSEGLRNRWPVSWAGLRISFLLGLGAENPFCN